MQTKRKIGKAFLELRRRYPIDRIRITELCRVANSNRTTFYHYFEDIYSLNEWVEDSILEECFENFPFCGMLYTDPDRYLLEFNKAIESRREDLQYLSKDREQQQNEKMEQWLVRLAKKDDTSPEEELVLRFVIAGVSRIISLNRINPIVDEQEVQNQLNHLIRRCLNLNES